MFRRQGGYLQVMKLNKNTLDICRYVEIKCQLDATDDIYCRFYCLLNMFRAPLCPSSGAREYTGGRCLWYLVLFEGYVSGLQAAARKPDT